LAKFIYAYFTPAAVEAEKWEILGRRHLHSNAHFSPGENFFRAGPIN